MLCLRPKVGACPVHSAEGPLAAVPGGLQRPLGALRLLLGDRLVTMEEPVSPVGGHDAAASAG